MNVLYKCYCMKAEADVAVPDRHPEQDVADWVQRCAASCIAADHAARSPKCGATTMEYMKIPLDNEERGIGFAPRKH